MKFIKIPGINGLGLTSPAKDFAQLIIPDIEEIKLDQDNLEKQQLKIYQKTLKLLPEKLFVLGGDHSISYPIGRAFLNAYKNPALIIFDAHPDVMQPLREPTHEEWLRALIESGFFVQNILLIGLRKIEPEEQEFLNKNNITIITPQQISENIDNQIKLIQKFCQNKNIYISFDIDVLDPSVAPATYYVEKNGLSLQEAKQLIQVIPKENIKLMDLVEIHTNHEKKDLDKTINSAREIISFLT